MSDDPSLLVTEDTQALVQRADQARVRLLRSVEALDRKRQQLLRPAVMVEKTLVAATRYPHPTIGLAVGGSILLAAGLTALAMGSRRQRAVFYLGRRPSFWREAAWRAGVGLATLALSEGTRLGLRALARPRRAPASGVALP
jgi:hypothetical protein